MKASPPKKSVSWQRWALAAIPLAWLWFGLLNNLRLEWATNPQYSYGWLVPFFCLVLLVRRITCDVSQDKQCSPEPIHSNLRPGFVVLLITIAFLYLPIRLIEGATPEWRPIQWALGLVAVGLTLGVVRANFGPARLKQVAFPIALIFVAIPWPTLFETPLIQGLTRMNSAIVVEVLSILGVPSVAHGNVIEVGTGVVGIDDACSGIRSFQSSLMISLVLGEFYWLTTLRRTALVPTAFIVAFVFNVCRTSVLTLIAARQGLDAISRYHDEAGLTILVACFLVTWGIALLLRGRSVSGKSEGRTEPMHGSSAADNQESSAVPNVAEASDVSRFGGRSCAPIGSSWFVALLVWLVLVEIGVEAWYRVREARLQPGPEWSIQLPKTNESFKELAIAPKTAYLLRFDQGQEGTWRENDGTEWSAFYYVWQPGRTAGYLAKRHTPDICMPATGRTLTSAPELEFINVHGVELPMRCYVFESGNRPLFVYQCRWESGAPREAYTANESARYNLVRGIWAGRGRGGQKVLELITSGFASPNEAREALKRQLEKLIVVSPEPGGRQS